jgi:UDP-3-O-[3-hydroxymyristoyl] glucosamine N-acyltransferase
LSDLAAFEPLTIYRNGQFDTLGFAHHSGARLLTFLDDARLLSRVVRNRDVSAVITSPELAPRIPERIGVATCIQPRLVFAEIHNLLAESGYYWKDFETVIDPGARIHPSAFVAERNVRIGAGAVVMPHATILERCLLAEDVMVGAGAVLGGEGFQRVRDTDPMLEMRHAGGLEAGRGARFLAGAVVATGLFRSNTKLERDVRVGSQAFVSHDVAVGERTLIGHGAVVNGNVTIGPKVWIGPGAVVSSDLTIGTEAFVSLGAVVIRDVAPRARLSGNFAIPHRRLLRALADLGEE